MRLGWIRKKAERKKEETSTNKIHTNKNREKTHQLKKNVKRLEVEEHSLLSVTLNFKNKKAKNTFLFNSFVICKADQLKTVRLILITLTYVIFQKLRNTEINELISYSNPGLFRQRARLWEVNLSFQSKHKWTESLTPLPIHPFNIALTTTTLQLKQDLPTQILNSVDVRLVGSDQ